MSDKEARLNQFIEDLKDDLGPIWDRLESRARDQVRQTAEDWVDLERRAFAGEDVEREMSHVHAQVASWTFEASSAAQRAFWAAAKRAAEFILALIKKAI